MDAIRLVERGYCDLAEEATRKLEERLYRRRRLLAGIRGYLLERSSPRWTVAGILAQALLAGAGAGWVLWCLGGHKLGWDLALSVVTAWPVFLFLLWRRARIEFGSLHLDQPLQWFICRDDGDCAHHQGSESPMHRQARPHFVHTGGSGSGNSGNPAGSAGLGLPVVIFLAAVTIGCWLMWELIRRGPELLALLIVDAHLVPSQPALSRHIESEPQCREILGLTAIYFLGFALMALIAGGDLSLMMHLFRGR